MARSARVAALAVAGVLLTACSGLGSDSSGSGGGGLGGPEPSAESSSAPTVPEIEVTPLASPNDNAEPEQLPETQGASGSGVDENSMDLVAVKTYLDWVVQDTDKVWSTWMTGLGYPEPYVYYYVIEPGAPITTETCTVDDPRTKQQTKTVDSQFPNAFYCGSENNGTDKGVILLPIETMAKTWSGDIIGTPVSDPSKVGDFAAATVVAHEFGHSVADELAEDMQVTGPQGKNAELLADCFAGVWTTALYSAGGLDDGDIDEALNALQALADKVQNPKYPHGTAAERDNAFRIGIYGLQTDPRGGVPQNCLSVYWPDFKGPV